MEEVCKICNKTFGGKKALGGHMRVHFMISKKIVVVDDKFKNLSSITCQQDDINDQDKKMSSRFAKNGVSCKQCGKGFPTNRSLSGHMKCHSVRSRTLDDFTDSEMKKRPRIEYEVAGNNSDFYGLNESFSVSSEVREVEMAAECLIMISTGVKAGVGLDLVTETSDDDDDDDDDNSDYFGAANDSEMKIDFSDDLDCKLDARYEMEVTSETSVDLIHSIDKIKKDRVNESPINLHCAQEDSMESTELGETDKNETISEFLISNSCQKSRVHAQNSGLERTYNSENAHKTLTGLTNQYVSEVDHLNSQKNGVARNVSLNSSKSKEYKCPVCFKVFSSGQAMGGHKRAHFAKSKSKEDTRAHQEMDEDVIDLNFPIAVEGIKPDHLWWQRAY